MPSHSTDPAAVALRLDAARRRAGLSFVELHRKLEEATPSGQECVTDEAVRRYCKGETWPAANWAQFLRLCEVLGESPLWVLFAVRAPKVSRRLDLSDDEFEFVTFYRSLTPALQQSLFDMARALNGQLPASANVHQLHARKAARAKKSA